MPAPKLLKVPKYCIVVDGQRALQHGVFDTKFDAAVKVSILLGQKLFTEDRLRLEAIWVSART
jgi:hypothetical protein